MSPLTADLPKPRSCRILVADDEPRILEEYRCVLGVSGQDTDDSAMADLEVELFGGDKMATDEPRYDVCLCRQGEEAVAVVRQAVEQGLPFAVAFLDVRMPPGIDGVTTAERLREIDPHMHIVFVTGYSDVSPEDIAQRVSLPEMLLFCQKPLHASELRQLAYALSEKWHLDRQLRTALGRLQQLMDSAAVVIYSASLSPNHHLTYVSDNVRRLFGHEPRELIGPRDFWSERVHPDDRPRVLEKLRTAAQEDGVVECEYRLKHGDGSYRWIGDRIQVLRDSNGRADELVGCWLDTTDRREAENRIIDLAYFDGLTGLPNRFLMKQLVERAISVARRRNSQLALLFLDVDNFKQVNDTLGHDMGDRLLKEVAVRLLGCIRLNDCLSRQRDLDRLLEGDASDESVIRLGGDEFVIVLPETAGRAGAAQVAARISDALSTPFMLGRDEVNVSMSIGITVFPNDALDLDTLLKNADMAMYQAKLQGRKQHTFYSEQMKEQAVKRFSMDGKLRKALERNEFEICYQPRVNLQDNSVTSTEALLRWRHPEDGIIKPLEFIPLLEENGLIVPIGDWVLLEACQRAASWARVGLGPLSVAVNLSAVQLRHKDLGSRIAQILKETGLDPSLLELELTESILMEDTQLSCAILSELKEIGVRITVDDFGTGYSSLSYLKRFPLNTLKIDAAFTRALPEDDYDATIVTATIALAHKLGLSVVAEGVENEDQMDFLITNQCDEGQGYLFSRPLEAEEFERWLTTAKVAGQPLTGVASAASAG